MNDPELDKTHVDTQDLTPAEPENPPLPERRPSELGTFIAALVAVAGGLGFDLDADVLLAGFIVIGLLPAIISHYVDLIRRGLRGEA